MPGMRYEGSCILEHTVNDLMSTHSNNCTSLRVPLQKVNCSK